MLPLEQRKGLVDQRQDVHAGQTLLLLHLDSAVKLLNGLLVLLLIEEELSVVIVDVGDLFKVLHAAAEGGHGRGDGAHLVLGDTELDVGEDEGGVEIDGLLVVLGGVCKLG